MSLTHVDPKQFIFLHLDFCICPKTEVINADDANIIDDIKIPYSVSVQVAFIIIDSTGGQLYSYKVLFILIIK